MLAWTVWLFYEIGKGTLAPWDPPSRLVTTGPYRYWRNPMISGVLLILGGEALFFNHLPLAIWTLFFLILNQVWFVLYEEPDLERRFGEEYLGYKNKTKRWLIN